MLTVYRDRLSGEIITEAVASIVDVQELPLPDDNWYQRDEVESSRYYGTCSASVFALVDDGGRELRWIPVEVSQ